MPPRRCSGTRDRFLIRSWTSGVDALLPVERDSAAFGDTPYSPKKALFLQGKVQAQSGQFKEAAESFAAHVAKFPAVNLRDALCGLGESQLHLNEIEKARDAFGKILGPKSVDADLDDLNERALLGLSEIALKAEATRAGAKKMRVLRIVTENRGIALGGRRAFYFGAGQ